MDDSIMNTSNPKLFVFSGADLYSFEENFLEELQIKGFGFLAIDVKAMEFASLHNFPYTIINDWLDTKTMLEIQEIAWDCENNWYTPVREEFTSNGVCWPEFDHVAMQWFWLDAITSLKLADAFRKRGIKELLIIKQKKPVPVVFFIGCGVHQTIWEKELADIITIIEPNSGQDTSHLRTGERERVQYIFSKLDEFINSIKKIPSLKRRLKLIIHSIIKIILSMIVQFKISISCVYSPPEILTGKIAFLASPAELNRSHDLLKDLISTFPKNVVIIPHQMTKVDVYKTIKTWKIPVIQIPENSNVDFTISKKFLKGYEDLTKESSERTWESIVDDVRFHFLYYCQNRWPNLNHLFKSYLKIFLKNPPKVIIGAALNYAEWHLPILAAKKCEIKTISIPHGVNFVSSTVGASESEQELLFDYNLYREKINKEILHQIDGIHEKKLVACKNCTDVNSHSTQIVKSSFSQNAWKILVLFDPTYRYSNEKYPLIYPMYKNPQIQIDAIKNLNSPPDDLKGKISIKFKVHPFFSELELFRAAGGDAVKNVLPTDTQLQSVLEETDLVIGVNYFGSALFHALKNNNSIILYCNDDFFETSYNRDGEFFALFGNSIKIAKNSDDLWNLIRTFFTDPAVSTKMKLDVTVFSKQFLDNSSFPTIGNVVKEIIQPR